MTTVTCFGQVQVDNHGVGVRLTPSMAETVAILVSGGPKGIPRSQFFELLNAEGRSSTPQAALMRVRRLRERFEERFGNGPAVMVGDPFGLDENHCDVDVWRFQAGCSSDDPFELRTVLELWDEPFANVDSDLDLITQTREQLRRSYTQALTRFGWMIEADFGVDLLHRIQAQIDNDPFNENLVASGAAAFFRIGQQVTATRLIAGCRAQLLEEFGLHSGPHIDEIELAILNQDHERLAARRPSATSVPPRRHNYLAVPEPSRFVGRREVLNNLNGELEAMGTGANQPGRFHLLIGEAGIGKTTLLQKFLAPIDPDRVVVRGGLGRIASVNEADFGLPGSLEIYRPLLEAVPELIPALAELETRDDAEQARLRFWQVVHNRLQELADFKPTVVVIDDVHSVDSQTMALFQYLAAAARPPQLMIVMTARPPGSLEGAAARAIEALSRSDGVEPTELGPLTLNEVRELVAIDHPNEPPVARDSFAQKLLELSEGHAMVISVLSRDAPAGLSLIDLPQSVEWEGTLSSYLAGKANSRELRQVLSTAAIVAGAGLEFDQQVLIELLDQPAKAVTELLEQAEQEGLCLRSGPGLWSFNHLLTLGFFARETNLLSPFICQSLARLDQAKPSDRVRYVLGAGNKIPDDEAIDILVAAADELQGLMAFREAKAALQGVLSRLDSAAVNRFDGALRQPVLVALAACSSRIGELDLAGRYRAEAFELARRADDPQAMYNSALAGLPAGEYVGGEPDRLEMLAAIDPQRLPPDRRILLYRWKLRIARVCDRADEVDAAIAAIDPSWAEEDPKTWVDLAFERLLFESANQGRCIYDELVAMAEPMGSGPERSEILRRAVIAALIEQRNEAIETVLPLAASEVRLHGSPRSRWSMDVIAAALTEVGMAGLRSDPDTALSSGLRWGVPDVIDAWGVQIWAKRWYAKNFVEALLLLDASQEARADNAAWAAAEAFAAAHVGQRERARSAARRATTGIAASPGGPWTPAAAALLIETSVVLDDAEMAGLGASLLAPRSGQAIVLGTGVAHLGPVDRYLGLARVGSDPAKARGLLTAAAEQAQRVGARVWFDEALRNLAVVS